MSQAEDIAERRQQMLGGLAELDFSAAKAAHASYLEAIGTDEETEKGLTYQRMSRCLRQTLALHEKLERANVRAAREDREDARRDAILRPFDHHDVPDDEESDEDPRRQFPRDIPAARARADELRSAVHRLIWSEGFEKSDCAGERDYEGDLVRWLELRIDEDRREDAFTETPLDDQVAEIADELDLNPDNLARWRELPEPDPDVILRYLTDVHSGDRTGRPALRRSSG